MATIQATRDTHDSHDPDARLEVAARRVLQSRCSCVLRSLLPLLVALLAAGLLVGCGGGDDDSTQADSSTDVDQLLKDTFSGEKEIKSGKIDLALNADAGVERHVRGQGERPVRDPGRGQAAQARHRRHARGRRPELQAGVTSTGDKGFVSYGGTDYEVSGPVFQQFKAGYEQSAKQAEQTRTSRSPRSGIDPRKWLTNAKNAGEAKVGDTDTIKITGDVDVAKLLDDVNAALRRPRRSAAPGQSLPEQLTEADKKQARTRSRTSASRSTRAPTTRSCGASSCR